ncbi:MAG: thioredoxin family protein, partial [Prosthecobacter sp.]
AETRGSGGGFRGHAGTGGRHFVFGKWRWGQERVEMKLSILTLLIPAVLVASLVWVFFELSRPQTGSPGAAAAGTAAGAIAHSTVAQPVMVEFYAEWCGPCQEMAPVVEALAREMVGQVRVIRVNVDEDPKLGYDHKVGVLPTFVVFKNGKETARESGAISRSRLQELVAK